MSEKSVPCLTKSVVGPRKEFLPFLTIKYKTVWIIMIIQIKFPLPLKIVYMYKMYFNTNMFSKNMLNNYLINRKW